MQGLATAHELSFTNRRHVSVAQLEAAIKNLVNAYHRCDLPKVWGSGSSAAADGTKYELAENGLPAEYSIRYGGYGGIAYHHVAASGADRPRLWRQERVRVAMPQGAKLSSETTLRTSSRNHVSEGAQDVSDMVSEGAPDRDMPAARGALPARKPMLPPVPADCPEELVEHMGADILAKVERRWPRKHHELGPCLVWTGPTLSNEGVYGRMYDMALKRRMSRTLWYGDAASGQFRKGRTAGHWRSTIGAM